MRLSCPHRTKGKKGNVLFIKVGHYNNYGKETRTQGEVLDSLDWGQGRTAILNLQEHLLKVLNFPLLEQEVRE